MSWQANTWVTEHSVHKGSELLCLIMIANHAHSDGTNAFPSMENLAAECRMSVRQMQRIIQRLEVSGELLVVRGTGRGNVHNFSLPGVKGDKLTPKAPRIKGDKLSERVTSCPIKGDISEQERVTSGTIKGDISESCLYRVPVLTVLTVIEPSESARAPLPSSRKKTKAPLTDEEYFTQLQENPAYADLDVRGVFARLFRWCEARGEKPARRQLLRWLKTEEKPMTAKPPAPPADPPRPPPIQSAVMFEGADGNVASMAVRQGQDRAAIIAHLQERGAKILG